MNNFNLVEHISSEEILTNIARFSDVTDLFNIKALCKAGLKAFDNSSERLPKSYSEKNITFIGKDSFVNTECKYIGAFRMTNGHKSLNSYLISIGKEHKLIVNGIINPVKIVESTKFVLTSISGNDSVIRQVTKNKTELYTGKYKHNYIKTGSIVNSSFDSVIIYEKNGIKCKDVIQRGNYDFIDTLSSGNLYIIDAATKSIRSKNLVELYKYVKL